jgi:hypothetical protein
VLLFQNLREAAERRKELENDHKAALDSLQQRQEEVKKLYKVILSFVLLNFDAANLEFCSV